MITFTEGKLHWNYFLALERDMEQVSRYVEFCDGNLGVFSIELAHLLFAAASEVDVVAKQLCKQLESGALRENINHYREVITRRLPQFHEEKVFIARYGMEFKPWENWATARNPDWWGSYNKVKHERDLYFDQAHLKNALNALGGLLVAVFYYHKHCLACQWTKSTPLCEKDVSAVLEPQSTLLRLDSSYYFDSIVC